MLEEEGAVMEREVKLDEALISFLGRGTLTVTWPWGDNRVVADRRDGRMRRRRWTRKNGDIFCFRECLSECLWW